MAPIPCSHPSFLRLWAWWRPCDFNTLVGSNKVDVGIKMFCLTFGASLLNAFCILEQKSAVQWYIFNSLHTFIGFLLTKHYKLCQHFCIQRFFEERVSLKTLFSKRFSPLETSYLNIQKYSCCGKVTFGINRTTTRTWSFLSWGCFCQI